MKVIALVLLFFFAALACSAAPVQSMQLLAQGNTPWHSVVQLRAALAASPQDPLLRQLLAQAEAIVGNEQVACALRPSRPPSGGQWVDAQQLLVTAVQSHRIVMFNESHDRSRHRAWVLGLLPMLHAAGFRALAAETFAADIQASTADGHVRSSSGVYVRDPVFASLVQQALSLGWELVAYEAPAESDASATREGREQAQAQALATWLGDTPQHKLVVLAGSEHINEQEQDGWMAARFKQLTGLDPLSVAQGATACGGEDPRLWPHPPAPGVYSVFDSARQADGRVDLVVHHLPMPAQHGRVGWLSGLAGRYPVQVCLPSGIQAGLLRAFAMDDPARQVIASDQVELDDGTQQAVLLLPNGHWWLAIENAHGQLTGVGQLVHAGEAGLAGCVAAQHAP